MAYTSPYFEFQPPPNAHFDTIMRFVSDVGYYPNFSDELTKWKNRLEEILGIDKKDTIYNSEDQNRIVEISPIDINIPIYSINSPPIPSEPNTDVDIYAYPVPSSPELGTVTVRNIDIPGFDVDDIAINLPGEIDIDAYMPSSPGAAPIIGDAPIVTKPTYTLPEPLVLSEIDMPGSPPSFTEPTMSMVHPGDVDFGEVTASFSFHETEYTSELKDLLVNALKSQLQNGGTGLGAEAEDALWQRGRDRQATLKERQYDEAMNLFASMGWRIPPGSLSAKIDEALAEQQRQDEQLNYEIMIKQAELANENTQKNIEHVLQLESEYIKINDNINQRALESSKALYQAAIDIVNAKISRYNARLEGFKIASEHYQAQYQAALLSLERWKAELSGKQIETEIQKSLIDAYNAKMASVKILSEIYQTEVDSARLQIEADKVRIEGYKETVNAYSSAIESVVARVNARNSLIEGEAKKADIYKSRVDAYASRVEASKIESDVQVSQIEAQLKANEMLIEKMKSELELYNTQINAAISSAKLKGEKYGYNIDLFKAQSSNAEADLQGKIESAKINAEADLRAYDKMLKEAELSVQTYLSLNELQKSAMDTATNVYAQILSSIYGILHASASGSAGGSVSYSVSADGGEV